MIIFLFLLLLPTQLGKHFFFDFSHINGVRVDYLAPTIYLLDLLVLSLFVLNWRVLFKHIKENKRSLGIICLLFFINILFAKVLLVALYGFWRLIEVYFVYIVFKETKLDPSLALRMTLLPLLIGSIVELGLAVAQISTSYSIQGIFYFLGERAFSVSAPGIATISLFDTVVLRPYGTFSHPNSMGGFYVLIYMFVLWMFDKKLSKRDSLLKYSLLFTSSCLVLLSFSKIAIGVLLLGSAYYTLRVIRLNCRWCKVGRVVTLATVSAIFLSGKSDILSWDKRVILLKQSWETLLQHPLGVGLGNSLYYQSEVTNKLPYFFVQPVHNIFLLFLVEAGVMIVGVMIYWMWRSGMTPRVGVTRTTGVILLVITVTGLVDHYWLTLIQNQLLLAVLLGLSMSNNKRAAKTTLLD